MPLKIGAPPHNTVQSHCYTLGGESEGGIGGDSWSSLKTGWI